MAITYSKELTASYNQTLQSYERKINDGTITQQELNQAKEAALQYYEYLKQSGISYGENAINVGQNSGFFGSVANGILFDAIKQKSPSSSESEVQFQRDKIAVSLALEDSFLRKEVSDGNISSREIADYHYDVFTTNNLPKEAWGGSFYEEFVGPGSWLNPISILPISAFKAYLNSSDNNGVNAKDAFNRVLLGLDEVGSPFKDVVKDFLDSLTDYLNDLFGDAQVVSDALSGGYQSFVNAVLSAVARDPLIVDVDGDGLSLSNWQSSGVKFDMDGNGTSESTGWTVPSNSNYEYNKGSGSIIIDKANANLIDRIVFGSGISKDSVTFSKVGVWDSSVPNTSVHYDLVITFNDSNNPNDKITILNYFRNPITVWENGVGTSVQVEPYKINGLKFADGSSFNFSDLKYQVIGTEGDDALHSGSWAIENPPETLINSGAGNDSIYGDSVVVNSGNGDDYFQLDNGANKISSGEGADWVRLGNGNNEVYTGNGDDQVDFGNGNNFISTGAGNDQINGYSTNGNNVINSGSGADIIVVDGNNIINGGLGEDTIYVVKGNNTITGGSGADEFAIASWLTTDSQQKTDIITDFNPNEGDKISLPGVSTMKFSYLTITQDGQDAVVQFSNQKIILKNFDSTKLKAEDFTSVPNGSEKNDNISDNGDYSVSSDIQINGKGGDDSLTLYFSSGSLFGDEGNDKLAVSNNSKMDGGSGNDTLTVSGHNNELKGGEGSDKFIIDNMLSPYQALENYITDFDPTDPNEKIIINNTIDAFEDINIVDSEQGAVVSYRTKGSEIYTNTITIKGVQASQLSADNFSIVKVNVLDTTSGNDSYNFSNSNESYSIKDSAGNDNYSLGSGNDYINDYSGSNTVNAGAGNDYVYIENGASIIDGQSGDDTIYFQSTNLNEAAFAVNGGEGDDYIDSYTSQESSNPSSNIISGGAGNDSINIQWGQYLNISGDAGNDKISTSSSNSIISSGDGEDIIELSNSASSNTVNGDSGNDTIIIRSNSNNNVISGGSGSDLFLIKNSDYSNEYIVSTQNFITDFDVNDSNEKIDLQFKDISDFAQLQITQIGSDASISFGDHGETIVLKNVAASNLTEQNFIFKKVGTANNDTIAGNNAYNKIDAGAGNDIISSTGKENYLNGGAGNDIFVIAKNPNSKTVIKDFSLFSAAEKIKLEGFANLDYSDLEISYNNLRNQGDYKVYNATIDLGEGQTLVVEGVRKQTLAEDRFLFSDLTTEELNSFGSSIEQLETVSTPDLNDTDSNNKIFSVSSDTKYISIDGKFYNSVQGTYISVTPQNNDDVFLVLDKNGNGNVDDVTELFGNNSRSGFEELNKYDSNADNVINSSDSQYQLLKFWNDANGNAKVDAGELKTLSESGVEEISLKTLKTNKIISGNLVTQEAEIKFTDGKVGKINEVFFATNNFNSSISNPDQVLGLNFTFETAALTLPYSRGYGNLYSWQAAMSLDPDLLEAAQKLANLSPSQFKEIDSLFADFLYKWADVDSISADSYLVSNNGTKIEARKIAFLEKITDLKFSFPATAAILQAQTSWSIFYNSLMSRFLVQSVFKDVFPDATYNIATDSLSLNTTLDQSIANVLAKADQLDQSSFVNYAYYSKNILQLNKDQFSDSNFDSKVDAMVTNIINSAAIEGFAFNGVFNIGGDDNETLFGSDKSDVIKGQDGQDTIIADAGNDYISGGLGNDYLKGGSGNDIYSYNSGDGIDIIEESSGYDKIIFGSGITQSSLNFARVGNDLVINIGSNGDRIGIKNFYQSYENKIDLISFADGTTFDLANLGQIIEGTAGADVIYGSNQNDVMNGGDGNDAIYGFNGNDIINAGKGDDYIEAGIYGDSYGDDIYIFNLGDGKDVIRDYPGNDKIIFGAGITKEDITLIPDWNNDQSLIIKIGDNGDQITIKYFSQYQNNGSKIETLEFADGSKIDLSQGLTINGYKTSGDFLVGTQYVDHLTGNIGDDSIFGGAGDDILSGGKGNDYIEEQAYYSGNDTYLFNLGDGQDTIYDFYGNDKILFGEGISKSDITLVQDWNNNNSLLIKVGSSGDQIRINRFFSNGNTIEKIETLQFADGSTMSLIDGFDIVGTNAAGEKLVGTDSSEEVTGYIGDDSIFGGAGDDILSGGKGNDYIEEQSYYRGNDTYLFNLGDGQDTIYDFYGNDKIVFGEGISKSDITLVQDWNNNNSLLIKVGSDGDQIRINRFFSNGNTVEKIETLQFADGSTMSLVNGFDIVGTNSAGEKLVGTDSSEEVTGYIGDDSIFGGAGDDILSGGKGNDYIEEQEYYSGNDTYLFNLGDGQDTIYDFYGNDKIVFGEGISKSDITLVQDWNNNNSLLIKVGSDGDQIRINRFFSNGNTIAKIETLHFADGSTMSLVNGFDIIGSNTAGETLVGTDSSELITGNIGDDTIYGNYGDDILSGGKGNDYIEKNGYHHTNDTYLFNLGDGQDKIYDVYGNDKIVFGEGISKSDIVLVQDWANNQSLIVKVGSNGDQIRINRFFSNGNTVEKIETLQFADGSTMSLIDGFDIVGTNAAGETLVGTDSSEEITGNIGDDAIYGNYGDDTLSGGKGNDYIEKNGYHHTNDTYLFNLGDGQDKIYDVYGNDKIVFGEGISKSDITLVQEWSNNNTLLIKVGSNGDQIRINRFFSNGNTVEKIETLQFADGSTMSLIDGFDIIGSNTAGETLVGTDSSEEITGNVGDDTIYGNYGDDTLSGGKGNDYIEKNGYHHTNDTYLFNLGDGQDTIYDVNGSDKIVFGEGISKSDITLVEDWANNQSLIIKIGSSGDQIRINRFFSVGNTVEKIETLQFADGSTMSLVNGFDIVGTNAAGETLVGTDSSELITGNIGDDTIYGNYGDDTLSGGKGNDYIEKNGYHHTSDTYLFNLGDGQDTIYDVYGNDKIVFGEGIVQSDISMTLQDSNLVINVQDGVDQIKIMNFYNGSKIETLQFSDGSTFNISEGLTISGTEFADKIITTPFSDNILGNEGNDYIYAGDGDNTINAGAGNDVIRAGIGNDTYNFSADFGDDSVSDTGGNDTINFDSSVDYTKISLAKNNQDLVIKEQNSVRSVTIANFFANSAYKIENLSFADGKNFDLLAIADSSEDVSYSLGSYFRVYEDRATKMVILDNSVAEVTAVSQALNGTVSYNAETGLIYQANSNYSGLDSFEISYLDQQGNSQTTTISLEVAAVNDAPVAQNLSVTGNEDESLIIDALASTSDVDSTSLSLKLVSNPKFGSIKIENGKFVYKPNANFNGQDSFSYKASDGLSDSESKTITLTIDPVNDKPVSVNDSAVVNENSSVLINITNNDYDVETGFFNGDSIVITQPPANGSLQIQTDGRVFYIPNSDFYGQDSFKYSLKDAEGLVSDPAEVLINVKIVNSAPKAISNSAISFNEDEVKTFDISDYFFDREGDALTLVSASAKNGKIEISGNQISYISNQNFFGNEEITLTIKDSNGAVATIVKKGLVNGVNDAPVALDDNFNISEDVATKLAILNNDNDVEDVLFSSNIISYTQPLNGVVTINESDGTLLYKPNKDYNGEDSFSYVIADSNGVQSTANVKVKVIAVNDAPTTIGTLQSYNIQSGNAVSYELPTNLFSDVDGDSLTIKATLADGSALPAWLSFDGNKFSGTPNLSSTTDFNVKVSATDNSGLSVSQSFAIKVSVSNPNVSPVARNDDYSLNEDTPLTISFAALLSNDSDLEDGANIKKLGKDSFVFSSALNGSVVVTDTGIVYTPNKDYNGTDVLTYQIKDSSGALSNAASINLNVKPSNDVAVAANDAFVLDEDSSITIKLSDLLANDFDVEDGDSFKNLTMDKFVFSNPSKGFLTKDAVNGTITYTSPKNYNGIDFIAYQVKDSNGVFSNKATISLNINQVNDAPIAVNDAYSLNEDMPFTIPFDALLSNDSDLEDGSNIKKFGKDNFVFGSVLNGSVVVTDTGIVYTPNKDYNGLEVLTYQIKDSSGVLSNVASINLNVKSINDVAIAANDAFVLDEDSSITIKLSDLLANDFDVEDGDSFKNLTMDKFVFSNPFKGVLTKDAVNGTITYTPSKNYNGNDSLVYQVKDSNGALSSKATINLTIKAVEDTPTAVNDSFSLTEDTSLNISFASLLKNDYDPEDGANISKLTKDSFVFGQPLKGKITVTDSGITYTPNKDYNGLDVLTYQIKDSFGNLSNQASINLNINPVNDAAVAVADSFTVDEDSAIVIKLTDLLANDFDIEGEDLAQFAVLNRFVFSNPGKGKIVTDAVNNTVTYTPNKDYKGTDTFYYKFKESSGNYSNIVGINLTINSVNDAPVVANKIANQSIKVENLFNYVFIANAFTDIEGDVLSYSAKLEDGSQLPEWLNFDSLTRTFSGKAPSSTIGSNLTITVTATDGVNEVSQNFVMTMLTNALNGNNANNSISGSVNNDAIYGYEGFDNLKGNNGDDTLIGGMGADVLFGGSGKDQFIFNNLNESVRNSSDTIMDFIRGEDKINLSGLGFQSVSEGLNSSSASENLQYYFDGKNTVIDDPNSDFEIKLVGDIKLDETDFIF